MVRGGHGAFLGKGQISGFLLDYVTMVSDPIWYWGLIYDSEADIEGANLEADKKGIASIECTTR